MARSTSSRPPAWWATWPSGSPLGHAHARGRARQRGPARRGGAQRLGVHVQHQARQILQRGAQACGVLRHVGDGLHLHELADAQRAAGELVDPAQARQIHLAAELRQRRGWQVVGFVDHEQAVVQLGQQPRAEGREQQIVVGHDDLRRHQLLAPLEIAALVEHGAMLARAGMGVGGHGAPELGLGRAGQLVAVAIPLAAGQGVGQVGVERQAFGLPRQHCARGALRLALVHGLGGQQVVGDVLVLAGRAAGQAFELELAHVAPAPLGQGEGKGLGHVPGQRGQVLVHQLLLQRHRGGGDQHARAARQRHGDGGHAVGQRLAHARARLHHGDGALGRLAALGLAQRGLAEGVRHLRGHAALARTRAKAGAGLHHSVELLQGLIGPGGGIHRKGSVAQGAGRARSRGINLGFHTWYRPGAAGAARRAGAGAHATRLRGLRDFRHAWARHEKVDCGALAALAWARGGSPAGGGAPWRSARCPLRFCTCFTNSVSGPRSWW